MADDSALLLPPIFSAATGDRHTLRLPLISGADLFSHDGLTNEKRWFGFFAARYPQREMRVTGDRRGATEKAHVDEGHEESSRKSGSITMVANSSLCMVMYLRYLDSIYVDI